MKGGHLVGGETSKNVERVNGREKVDPPEVKPEEPAPPATPPFYKGPLQVFYRCRRCGVRFRTGVGNAGMVRAAIDELTLGEIAGNRLGGMIHRLEIHQCEPDGSAFGIADVIGAEPPVEPSPEGGDEVEAEVDPEVEAEPERSVTRFPGASSSGAGVVTNPEDDPAEDDPVEKAFEEDAEAINPE